MYNRKLTITSTAILLIVCSYLLNIMWINNFSIDLSYLTSPILAIFAGITMLVIQSDEDAQVTEEEK